MSDWKDHIEKYRRGELSPSEIHELEKKALSDPFLADALEGVSKISPDELSADLAELNKAIQPAKHVVFTPLRIAAGVVVLISAALYLWWPNAPVELEEQIVKSDTVKEAIDSTRVEEKLITKAEEPKVTKPRVVKEPKQTPVPDITKVDTTAIKETVTDAVVTAPPVTKISGTVSVAEDGLPLPGVSIRVKGTTKGTTTDINGNYSLEVPDNLPLVFSFVGMETTEVATADKSSINVKMNEDVAQLSEVVVTRSAIKLPTIDGVKLAEPEGGIKAYDQYMEDNLRYPQQALDNNVKGRVVVEFNVGIDGALNNFVIMKSLGYGCDDEVLRLVKEGPVWKPTTEDNKPVESTVRVRMKFDPNKLKGKKKR
ncbi:MAG TPA: TonB family protein [Cyclobacteriaceae bacterium]|nr:TonB family protein [Cyclobacteriaceae bacterium]